MNDKAYRAAIDELRTRLATLCAGSSVGVIVPAAMEIVLAAIMAIDEKPEALRATQSLRPMIDYIESQLQGTH